MRGSFISTVRPNDDHYYLVRDGLVRVEETLQAARPAEFPALARILDHVLGAGGKRMRPAMALLAGKTGRYDLDLLVPLAASIELLHSATLVHDDVIDAAATRRGRETANALIDNAATVMVGDYMFAHAAELVARTGNIEVIRLFARTLMEMATGELHQDMSAYNYGQSTREYFNRIAGKTASLFATAAQGGAMVAGLPEGSCLALRSYGESLGMAFQIVDDILDFSGDEAEMGKPAGSDLMQGTLTLPALLLIERDPENNPVKRYFAGIRKAENLRRSLEMIRESDILDESYSVAYDFRDRALRALDPLPSSEAKESLVEVAYWATQRRA
jgi:geranylgeranyl pyrophosphate synthase